MFGHPDTSSPKCASQFSHNSTAVSQAEKEERQTHRHGGGERAEGMDENGSRKLAVLRPKCLSVCGGEDAGRPDFHGD